MTHQLFTYEVSALYSYSEMGVQDSRKFIIYVCSSGGVIKRTGLTYTVSNAPYLNGGNGHVKEASEEAHDQPVNHADHIVREILVYLLDEESKRNTGRQVQTTVRHEYTYDSRAVRSEAKRHGHSDGE